MQTVPAETVTIPALPGSGTPAPASVPDETQAPTAVTDPTSIREFAPCEPSQNGTETNGYRGAPLKSDVSQWIPQH